MLIAQITDLHVEAPGIQHATGYCPAAAIGRVVEALGALDPPPDLVVVTGDVAATAGTAAEYGAARAMLAALALPAVAVPGNHDDRAAMRAAFAGSGVRTGGPGDHLQVVADLGPLRLIGLDTTEPGRVAGGLCAARLGWLAARLEEAPDRTTVIFMHHPPFPIGMDVLDGINCAGGEALAAVVAGHRQVRRLLAGHVHRAVHTDWAGIQASTAPSVAYEFPLDRAPGAPLRPRAHPPGFQLHEIDGDGGMLTHTIFLP
jgi:3',5'-cyclic-AMP phosphodiesterase